MKTLGYALIGMVFVLGVGCSEPANSTDEATEEVSRAWEPLPPGPAPIAYWTFDTCTGNVVPNIQGAWGAANLLNDASCGPGAFGTAGVFDGVDDRAEVAYDSRLDFTTAMSVSAWVKPTDTTSPQTIVGKWYAPDSYLLWLSNGQYRFSVALSGGATVSVATPATAGVFAKVVGTFNGSTLRIYINGDLMAATNASGTLQSSTRPVTIGNHPSWNPFAGAIDEVRLYSVALPTDKFGSDKQCAGCNPPSGCCDP